MAEEPCSLMDALTKEEKEALLAKRIEDIRRKNKDREERHKEIEADRKHAEGLQAAVRTGTTPLHNRHSVGGSLHMKGSPIRDDSWQPTGHREDESEGGQNNDPSYLQQPRQRGGRAGTGGSWSRGSASVQGSDSPSPHRLSSDGQERDARAGMKTPSRVFTSQRHAALDSDIPSATSSATNLPLVPSSTRDSNGGGGPEPASASKLSAGHADARSLLQNGQIAEDRAQHAHYGNAQDVATSPQSNRGRSAPSNRGSSRGRGRGITPAKDHLPTEAATAARGRQRPAGGQQQGQQRELAERQSERQQELESQLRSIELQEQRALQHHWQQSGREWEPGEEQEPAPGEYGGHDPRQQQPPRERQGYSGQRREQLGHAERRPPQYQSYEETRKKNAAAYEEALRSSTSSSSGGFLADRNRDVQTDFSKTNEELRQMQQQYTDGENRGPPAVRHQRNFGGPNADLQQVKSRVREVAHERPSGRRGKPLSQRSLEVHMTGHERQQYAAWLEDRQRIDAERLERAKAAGGWRRAWDVEKDNAVGRDANRPQGWNSGPRGNARRTEEEQRGLGRGDEHADASRQQRSPDDQQLDEVPAHVPSSAYTSRASRGQGRQRRSRKRMEDRRTQPDSQVITGRSASSQLAPADIDVRSGSVAAVSNNATEVKASHVARVPHVGEGDGPQQHKEMHGAQAAERSDVVALPAVSASDGSSVETRMTVGKAVDSSNSKQLPVESRHADVPCSDDEWEDVDDDDDGEDDEDYEDESDEVQEDTRQKERPVLDWAAEVEQEYGEPGDS